MDDSRSGAGHVQDKYGFRSTFHRTEQVLLSPDISLFSFARGYRTGRTAWQRGRVRVRYDRSGVKECDQMRGCGDAVVHSLGILVKTKKIIPPVI